MLCTARSTVGLALISTCQSPVRRLTLNVWSAGSPKFARPSRVEVVPDPAVREGGPGTGFRSVPSRGSLVLVQARKVRSARAPAGAQRNGNMGTSKASGDEWHALSPGPVAPYTRGRRPRGVPSHQV